MEGHASFQDVSRIAAPQGSERNRRAHGHYAHPVGELVPRLPLHGAAEGKQERARGRHLLRIVPQRRRGLDQSPQRLQRQDREDRDQGRGRGALEARRGQGNDPAGVTLSVGEELLRLPRRAARGTREQRWPCRRQRVRAGVVVAWRGPAQHLAFQGQGEHAAHRREKADALSHRPRRRTRGGIARGRQGDGETDLCVRDGQARRPGAQAACGCCQGACRTCRRSQKWSSSATPQG